MSTRKSQALPRSADSPYPGALAQRLAALRGARSLVAWATVCRSVLTSETLGVRRKREERHEWSGALLPRESPRPHRKTNPREKKLKEGGRTEPELERDTSTLLS